MNILINKIDNLIFENKSIPFIPEDVQHIHGMIVGANGSYFVKELNVMKCIELFEIQKEIGTIKFNELMRKPKMVFLFATEENEFSATKEDLDKANGIKAIHLNNFAQALSLGCWLVKDSCVSSTDIYQFNPILGYTSIMKRGACVTKSNGAIESVSFTETEINEAIDYMYDIYNFLLPEHSNMGRIQHSMSNGSSVWEIDKAISSEGDSFAKALIYLQEARRTGVLASKIDKYCSILESLFAIKENHTKYISCITACYLSNNYSEQSSIKQNMLYAYGIRSDNSHGGKLKFLKDNNIDNLKQLSITIDEYVRKVFRKIILQPQLNYKTDTERQMVRAHFKQIGDTFLETKSNP